MESFFWNCLPHYNTNFDNTNFARGQLISKTFLWTTSLDDTESG